MSDPSWTIMLPPSEATMAALCKLNFGGCELTIADLAHSSPIFIMTLANEGGGGIMRHLFVRLSVVGL